MTLGLCAHCGHEPKAHNDMGTSCKVCSQEVALRVLVGDAHADACDLAEYDCFDLDV